jgi:diguanylate cyclase (GGDEF)-like protein
MNSLPASASRYIVGVYAAAVAAVVWFLMPHVPLADVEPEVLLLLAVFTLLGELRPINAPLGREGLELTTSNTFAFAILLAAGPALAALTLAASAMVSDVVGRKSWWKVLFNAAQYVLCIVAAGVTVDLLKGPVDESATTMLSSNRALFAAIAAALVFFVTNVSITGVALALAQRLPLLTVFRQDFAYQTIANTALLALAPVAVVVGNANVLLLPLLLVPLGVAYRSATVSLEKEHQARHDSLTGLPNRLLFRQRTHEAIQAASRHGTIAAIMLIDLDRFKEVNDTLGHHVGDRILQWVGPRLQEAVRPGDTVARLGGDEFGVVLPGLPNVETAIDVAGRLSAALSQPIMIDGLSLSTTGSIGVSLYPEHGTDVDTLMQRADVAMYVAKESHQASATYHPSLDHNSPSRLALVGELQTALADGQFVVHYQPKVSVETQAATGAEALIRWEHPRQGVVPPSDFIPIAEQTGLIHALTAFVIGQALGECKRWAANGHDISVAVNLSPRTLLDPDFPAFVAEQLEVAGVQPQHLVLEITETMIMADPERSRQGLVELRRLGVRLSVDDYGTGHSSLSYLKQLPINEMKIDKSFITNMTDDHSDAVITRSTVDLAHRLGLTVVAEGVETAETSRLLASIGCDEAQGYYFSRPIPAAAFLAWLDRHSGRAWSLDDADAAFPAVIPVGSET